MNQGKKILLALSGGVDSAVAGALLIEQGYEVVGGFMKCWSGDNGFDPCWIEDRRDALRVSAQLNISLHCFDFEKEYREHVVSYMYREYAEGRTPNPDVLCNSLVKFDVFLREADRLGCDMIATGHYARKKIDENGCAHLMRGADHAKDQSYFLHRLNQQQLHWAVFPVGEFTKTQVREMAKLRGLCVAEKKSTRGICFVGNIALKTFLKDVLPSREGEVVNTDGVVIGKHEGAYYFTVGQRHGFGVGGGIPYYVVNKDVIRNRITVAQGDDHPALLVTQVHLEDMHWIVEERIGNFHGHVRYQHSGVDVMLQKNDDGSYGARFAQSVRGVPPGQFLVLYDGEECVGGGVIVETSP